MKLGGSESPGIDMPGPIAPISPKAMLGILLMAPKISGGSVRPAGMGPKREFGDVEPLESSEPGDLGNENDTACRVTLVIELNRREKKRGKGRGG